MKTIFSEVMRVVPVVFWLILAGSVRDQQKCRSANIVLSMCEGADMRKITWIWTSALFGFLLGWTIRAELAPNIPPELELEAYRTCMSMAAVLNCHMGPKDFVRYYELKYKLEDQ